MKPRGITLLELLVVIAIMGILATAAMPMSRITLRRAKEIQLRNNLRILRTAIDAFHRDCLPPNTPGSSSVRLSSDYCKSEQDYYPESLEQLIEPLKLSGTGEKTKKYLRRIPRDPLTPLDAPDKPNNWGLRSHSDQPDSTSWGGDDVYDVYSKSETIALDGSKYNTW